jgi:hypothetical protein
MVISIPKEFTCLPNYYILGPIQELNTTLSIPYWRGGRSSRAFWYALFVVLVLGWEDGPFYRRKKDREGGGDGDE